MMEIRYLDFDLLIELSQQGYMARVLNSPAGQAVSEFSLPFTNLELENFLLRVGRTRRGVRRLESPEMEAAKNFGGRLFDAVFMDEVRGCLRSSIDEANRQGARLRLRLRLANAPDLANLPWEYLYNPALNRFLSLSTETPLVRYLDMPERISPLAVEPPLRVLVMIASPSDYPRLDVEGEWTKLKESLGDVERQGLVVLERLDKATLADLLRGLRQEEYHIFHFIGHGTFDERTQDGLLLLEDEEKRGFLASGQYLGTLLHDERTLRLAILNACEGARSSISDPFAGAAQSLVQQGIPAVIAMQFEITDKASITFAREFYSALADDYPVDAALTEARKAIFAQGNDVEWGTPVLYSRSADGAIFDIPPERPSTLSSSTLSAKREVQPSTASPSPRPSRLSDLALTIGVIAALVVAIGGAILSIRDNALPVRQTSGTEAVFSLTTDARTTTAKPAGTGHPVAVQLRPGSTDTALFSLATAIPTTTTKPTATDYSTSNPLPTYTPLPVLTTFTPITPDLPAPTFIQYDGQSFSWKWEGLGMIDDDLDWYFDIQILQSELAEESWDILAAEPEDTTRKGNKWYYRNPVLNLTNCISKFA